MRGDRLPPQRLSIGIIRGQRGTPRGHRGGPPLADGVGPGRELGQRPGQMAQVRNRARRSPRITWSMLSLWM
jgi:hypothetical protein